VDIKELLQTWDKSASVKLAPHEYRVRLSLHDAARLAALAELYPPKSEAEIITELLTVALDQLQAALPYQQGSRVIAEDELGDPIYEDIGLTPRFLVLSKRHADRLLREAGSAAPA
jgi:hypothetical protein